MWQKIAQFAQTRGGSSVVVAIAVCAIGVAAWTAWGFFGSNAAVDVSSHTVCVCSETGKSFNITLKNGMTFPVPSPYSGKNTGYPAELCYWTKEGTVKKEPTAVLMNAYINKPEPTFCPECGRLVVPRNPAPGEGAEAPPTREQYLQRRHGDQ